MWLVLNRGPCRAQNADPSPQAPGASGCEGIVGTGLLCLARQLISLGQETPGRRPGISPGSIAVCLP